MKWYLVIAICLLGGGPLASSALAQTWSCVLAEQVITGVRTSESVQREYDLSSRIGLKIGEATYLTEGAQSIIFVVKPKKGGEEVILKISRNEGLNGEFETQAAAEKKFHEELAAIPELRALARHFPQIMESGTLAGVPYILYRKIKGRTVGDLLSNNEAFVPGMETDLLIDGLTQIASGLHALHSLKRVHFDFKPDNIMVERDPGGKGLLWRLTDLGLMTAIGTERVAGTRRFLHPARLAPGHRAHPRDDFYGLGLTIRQLLTATESSRPIVERESRRREALSRLADRMVNLEVDNAEEVIRELKAL